MFAMLVVYYAIVPPSKPRYFGALGLDFSDKAFTFAVAGMVRNCFKGTGVWYTNSLWLSLKGLYGVAPGS